MPNIFQTRLHEVCDSIVHHVYDVSPQKYRIDAMTLFMKKDNLGSIYFLFCTSLQVTKLCEKSPTTINKTATYKPVVTPMYFNKSPSVESCAVTLRLHASQSMRHTKKNSQCTLNTSRSVHSSLNNLDESEASQDSTRMRSQIQGNCDLWETKPLTNGFKSLLMTSTRNILQKKSARRQPLSMTKHAGSLARSYKDKSAFRATRSASSKRRQLEQSARPCSAPTALITTKKKEGSEGK